MNGPLIFPLGDLVPKIAASAFVAPGAVVTGDVELGEDVSLWYHVVARGDAGRIRIGARTNVQDHSMIHMSTGRSHALIGEDVTIGHRAVIHGCIVEDRCLIGMGAVVMDNAVIGADSIVGAGTVITANTIIPPRSLVLGSPGRVKKELTPDETAWLVHSASHYVELAAQHRDALAAHLKR